jgi:HEAT repeat protein
MSHKMVNLFSVAFLYICVLTEFTNAGLDPNALGKSMEKISTYNYGQSRQSLTELTDMIRPILSSGQDLKIVEAHFDRFLKSNATLAAKQFICQQLSIFGTEDSVPVLAAMLSAPSTSDMARYALEQIQSPAVDQVLRAALPKTTGNTRIGIINSLGQRRDGKSVSIFSVMIYDSNQALALASAAALGQIADTNAADVLAQAKTKTSGKLQNLVLDAYLKCADRFAASSELSKAIEIYQALYDKNEPAPIRIAAMRGLAAAEPSKAIELVIKAIKNEEPPVQAAAIVLIHEIQTKEIVGASVAELPNLEPAAQVQLISALADRGNTSALPAVIMATKSAELSVRIAALKALAHLGDASAAILLAQTAACTKGVEQDVSRRSLYALAAPGTDQAVLSSVTQPDPKVSVELIRAIAQRNILSGVDTLLNTVKSQNPDTRLESIHSLAVVAVPKNASIMVNLLINSENDAEQREYEKMIAVIACKPQGQESCTAAVLEAMSSVQDSKVKCSLLRILSKIANVKSLSTLQQAINNADLNIQTEAIRALSEWPSPEPIADLRKVIQTTENKTQRAIAMRGFVRLIGLDSNLPAERTLQLYKEAFGLASDASEKKMVLAGLSNLRSPAALDLAIKYLDDKELQQEAEAAVVKIATTVSEAEHQKARSALQRVLATSKNDTITKQAQETLDKIKHL